MSLVEILNVSLCHPCCLMFVATLSEFHKGHSNRRIRLSMSTRILSSYCCWKRVPMCSRWLASSSCALLCHIQTINPIEYIFLSSNNYTGIDHNKINTKLNTKINNTKINNNKINTKINTKINNTKLNTKINNTKLNTKINNTKLNTKINNKKINTKINNTKINTKINNNNDNKNNNDDTCWRLQLRIEQPLWPPCHHRQQVPLPPHRQSKVCAVQSVGTVLRDALPPRPQVERQHPNMCLLRHLLQPQQRI